MYIHVIGKYRWELSARTIDKVHAKSHQAAVDMVFANKLLYPVVTKRGKKEWIVHVAGGGSRIHSMHVRCETITDPQP